MRRGDEIMVVVYIDGNEVLEQYLIRFYEKYCRHEVISTIVLRGERGLDLWLLW